MFLKNQLKNRSDIISSSLQQSAKSDNIFVECDHVSSHKTSDKMHYSCSRKNYNKITPIKNSFWTHQLLSMRLTI